MRLFLLLGSSLFLLQDPTPRPGYDDTPVLPGQTWKVHDRERPYPQVVQPGRTAADAPGDATVLFDGTSLEAWVATSGKETSWRIEDGAMVVAGGGDLRTREAFGDCQLHIEWATPADRKGGSQGMGNSGVFLMGLYEIQVLDTFDNPSYADGTAGSVYGQFPPDVNVCRPSGEWQSYDILFRAPRFDDQGKRTEPARITVLHNGVAVHVDRELLGPTVHRALPPQQAHPTSLPLKLQDHGDAVRYRNIWIRPLK